MNNKDIDLISVPKKSFWRLTIPILGFIFFNAMYGLIDLYWVSRLDAHAFYAAGVSIPIFTLICTIGDSIGQGTNSLMSRSIGADDYDNAYNAIFHGILLCLAIWIIIMFLVPLLDDLLLFLQVDESIDLIITYLAPIFFCSIFFIIPNFFSETLRSEGDALRPTIIIIFCNILNLVLDPILIFNFNFGLKGAAYATIISSFLCGMIFLYLYLGKKTKIPLKFKFSKLNSSVLIEILTVAIPNFFKDSLYCTMALFINGILLDDIGQIGVLLYSTSIKIEDLLITPIRAYGRGMMSVAGQLFGSKKITELKKIYHYVLKITFVTAIVISIVFVVFRDYIFYSFSIWGMEWAVQYIAVIGILIFLSDSALLITSKMIDSFGKSYYNIVFTFLLILFEVGLISLIREKFPYGSSVLIGIAIALMISTIIYYIFLRYLFRKFEKQNEEDNLIIFKK